MNPPAKLPPVWTEPLRIHSYDVDCTACATTASLCRCFLEAAWNHAEALGVGFGHLARQGKVWVLSRLLVRVEESPRWGAVVTLRTWPRTPRSVFALRDFEFADTAGTRLAAGTASWLVIDAATRRPQRLHTIIPDLMQLSSEAALERDADKLREEERGEPVFSVVVRYSDIDMNRHVNSARYVGWMLDAHPLEFHSRHRLRELEVNYLGEGREGDVLAVHVRPAEALTFNLAIVRSDGAEMCRARLLWEPAAEAGAQAAPQCAVGPAGGQLGFTPK